MQIAQTICEESMPPKKGYKQPGREGKVQILVHLDEDLRTAFKLTAIERGETMNDAIVRFVEEYSADTVRRLKRKS